MGIDRSPPRRSTSLWGTGYHLESRILKQTLINIYIYSHLFIWNLEIFLLLTSIFYLKFNFQLKPPYVRSEPVRNSKVSSEITSIIGQMTFVRSFLISYKSGSSQPGEASMWASRNVKIFPEAFSAPTKRALIRPWLRSYFYLHI